MTPSPKPAQKSFPASAPSISCHENRADENANTGALMPATNRAKKPKPRGPILTQREALAMGFRRWIIRTRAAEAKALGKAEEKAERQHQARIERREGTNKLALSRIEACARHPTPFAVEQLADIARNEDLAGHVRIEAAKLVLKLGHGGGMP